MPTNNPTNQPSSSGGNQSSGGQSGISPSEPSRSDLQPIISKGVDKEVICLLDTSGSMSFPAAPETNISRKDIVGEAMHMFVAALEGQDSQKTREQAGGSDELGGLLIHGFSSSTEELGDFNTSNLPRKWSKIQWGGGTYIMPAWEAAQSAYLDEFGDTATIDRPHLLTLVVTDGEAEDGQQFGKVLESAGTGRYFLVAIVGYGAEHDATMKQYQSAASSNPQHVKVASFDSVTNPEKIAGDLIALAGVGG